MKTQDADWDKILAKQISNKGLYLDYVKNLCNSIIRKVTQWKWGTDLNRCSTKEHTQMEDKHMKKCPTSFSLWKCAFKP